MDKPELDYAFLADFAQVSANKLTAVGASYTHLRIAQIPTSHMIYVAGRVRSLVSIDSVNLRVEAVGPDGSFRIGGDFDLSHNDVVLPYNGKVGILFSVGLEVPVVEEGLFEVHIHLEGEPVRRLAFDVSIDPES